MYRGDVQQIGVHGYPVPGAFVTFPPAASLLLNPTLLHIQYIHMARWLIWRGWIVTEFSSHTQVSKTWAAFSIETACKRFATVVY